MSNVPPPPPSSSQPEGFQPPAYAAPAGSGMGAPVAKSNGMGVAALVLGILSILGGLFVVGGILGVLAVIFGFVGRGRAKRGEADNGGMALAGIITGIIGILLSVLILVLAVFLVSSDGFKSFTECIDDADGDQAKIEKCELDF